MFKISVQTGNLDLWYGIDGAYRFIKEAGFDAVDANVDHYMSYGDICQKRMAPAFSSSITEKEMLETYFKPYLDASHKYGIENYQAHAPFPSMLTTEDDSEWNEQLIEMLRKTIIGCAYAECHNLVIHPFFKDYHNKMSREKEWEVNIESYLKLAKTAIQCDVTINLENMFVEHNGKVYAAVCNDGQMAAKYIDTLNEAAGKNCFGFCLDTGHALLASQDIKEFILDLGKRLTCFHVHDNDGVHDLHQAPYTGKMDWNRFMEGVHEIGFDRTMSFETFNALNTVDRELIPETLRFIAACGHLFDRKVSAMNKC